MAQNHTYAVRPKRAVEEFARASGSTSKKPRFDYRNPSTLAADAPEEDLILDADVIGRSGPQTKRNAVNIDGYESDSENDNFDTRAEEKARKNRAQASKASHAGKSKAEEDDDMFAEVEEDVQGTADGDDDEGLTREGKKKKKDVRFLEQDEIEGQVLSSKSGGHVTADLYIDKNGEVVQAEDEESVSSSSGEEEDRDQLPDNMDDELAAEVGAGGKKKHAPRLDAFNLKQEGEDGRYDESGNFVRKAADPDAVNDNWLDGLSRKEMRRAKEAQEKREDDRRRKTLEDDAVLTSDLLSTLITALETGETTLEALARLNKGKSREVKLPKWKQKRSNKNRMELDEQETEKAGAKESRVSAAEAARREAVERITGAADALYSRGQHQIYEIERELLQRQYQRETGDVWRPPAQDISSRLPAAWEYRWKNASDNGEIHGPFEEPVMKQWETAGFFGEGVEFRKAGGGEWVRVLEA